ncbi:unnamed protein product [Vicia faba]|uniref:Uncharacterized protein n=1 Tax=Vicia faba TaxID=3906 RepID=A0AAV0ZCK8_VICFA|nr:unnamed protein product [Vicia faba]
MTVEHRNHQNHQDCQMQIKMASEVVLLHNVPERRSTCMSISGVFWPDWTNLIIHLPSSENDKLILYKIHCINQSTHSTFCNITIEIQKKKILKIICNVGHSLSRSKFKSWCDRMKRLETPCTIRSSHFLVGI